MTVKECYEQMKGNYGNVLERLGKEERIQKYLEKFLNDQNYGKLCTALEEKDYKNGFIYAHNLKGVSCNLEMTMLAKSTHDLCDDLRGGSATAQMPSLLEKVKKDYHRTVTAIQSLVS